MPQRGMHTNTPEGYWFRSEKAGRPKVDRAVEWKIKRYVTGAPKGHRYKSPEGIYNVSKKKKKKDAQEPEGWGDRTRDMPTTAILA